MNEHSKVAMAQAESAKSVTNPLCELGVTDDEYKNLCDFLTQNYFNMMEELYGEKAQAEEEENMPNIFDSFIDAYTPINLLKSPKKRTTQEILSESRNIVEKSFYTALSGYNASLQKD